MDKNLDLTGPLPYDYYLGFIDNDDDDVYDYFLPETVSSEVNETIAEAKVLFLILTAIFCLLGFILLSATCSKQVRGMTPSWLGFHLIIVDLLKGTVLHSIYASRTIEEPEELCSPLNFFTLFTTFLINFSVVFINVETILSILVRLPSWRKRHRLRLTLFVCTSWVVNLLILGYIFTLGIHSCQLYTLGTLAAIHLIGNLIPGLLIVIATVMAVVVFKVTKYRPSKSTGNTRVRQEARQWLTMLVLLNSVYLLLYILPNEILLRHTMEMHTELYLRVAVAVTPLICPFSLLAVSDFRMAVISCGQKLCSTAGCNKSRQVEVSRPQNVISSGTLCELYV